MYNEMVMIKMVQSMTKLIQSPPDVFRHQIERHFKERGIAMYERIKSWMEASNDYNNRATNTDASSEKHLSVVGPMFSLVPASRGFCLTLSGLLENFRTKIDDLKNSNEGSNL